MSLTVFSFLEPVEIIVTLGFPFKLNYIEMTLSDLKGDKFSYLIEYSVDGFNWFILYDYRKYLCSNHQTLFFNPIVSGYFRIKGFHQNRMDVRTRKAFKSIKTFKAFFKDMNAAVDVRLTDGVLNTSFYSLQIKHRVYCEATVSLSAEERYYCQKICKDNNTTIQPTTDQSLLAFKDFKPIFILFDQPIISNAFSFRLFDHEPKCAYSYVVDILDQNKLSWECVADRSTEKCTSWQKIVYSTRPINLVRILCIKIHNSDSQEFRIFKFNFTPNGLNV